MTSEKEGELLVIAGLGGVGLAMMALIPSSFWESNNSNSSH